MFVAGCLSAPARLWKYRHKLSLMYLLLAVPVLPAQLSLHVSLALVPEALRHRGRQLSDRSRAGCSYVRVHLQARADCSYVRVDIQARADCS